MKIPKLREEVVRICKDMYHNGLVRDTGTGGNVSSRDPDTGLVVVTPSQVRYDTITAEDMVVMDLEGEVVESKSGRVPTSEAPTHLLIYREFSDVNAVIHTHSPYANVLASLYSNIPAAHTEFAYFIGDKIPVTEWVTPGTDAMAESVVEKLEEASATVLRNHGPVVVAEDLNTALNRALAVEDSSKVYYKALCLGEPTVISEDECKKLYQG